MSQSVFTMLPAVAGGAGLILGGPMAGLVGLVGGSIVSSLGNTFAAANAIEGSAWWIREQRQYEAMIANQQAELMEANLASVYREIALLEGNDELNEIMGERERLAIQSATETNAQIVRRQGQALAGQQVVGYLKSGVKLEGTPAAVIESSRKIVEEDVASILAAGRYDEINSHTASALYRIDTLSQAASKSGEAATTALSARSYRQSARHIIDMLPYDIWSNSMQAWSTRVQGVGSLFTTLGNIGMRMYRPTGADTTSAANTWARRAGW